MNLHCVYMYIYTHTHTYIYKESAYNVGNLGSIPGLGRSPGDGEWLLPTPVIWPGEFHELYSPWGCKESDTTE